jgi:hypothetical protein
MNDSWKNAVVAGCPKQFLLPPVVDAALESLLEGARSEGNRMSRSDIVAALIWQARGMDGDALGVVARSCLREVQAASVTEVPEPVGRTGPRPYAERSSQ